MFWFFAVLMILVALAIIFRHLFFSKQAPALSDSEEQSVIEVYRQRFEDLERDLANGSLSPDQLADSRLELEHALLAETGVNQTLTEKHAASWGLNMAVILLLPLFAILLYNKTGQPDLLNMTADIALNESPEAAAENLPSIEELVVGLEQKLEQNPDDEKGLWMLTRTYMALGRYEDALVPVKHLYGLSVAEPAVILLYANVLMLNNNESFSGEPTRLIEEALRLEPQNVTGLWLAGLAARQNDDRDTAIKYWQRLLPLLAGDAASSEQIQQLLQEAGVEPAVSLTVSVSLSDALRTQLDADDTLFVFARADDGMPMPVAVSKLSAEKIPLTLVLSDAMAMMPSRRLSAFEQVSVTARVSKSGNAIAQSGDLTSDSQIVKVGKEAEVKLLIDQTVP